MPCYETHRRLAVDDGCFIRGGNGAWPVPTDAHLYVGFKLPLRETPAPSIPFPITDFRAPADADAYKTLVALVSDFLRPDRKVHAGCVGGHGRTGTFLAALVAYRRDLGIDGMAGIADPIDYVWRAAAGGRSAAGFRAGVAIDRRAVRTAETRRDARDPERVVQ